MASCDVIIRGGRICDGTSSPGFIGDVAVDAGRIVAVGEVSETGREEIDACGRVVTPGFVDIHTHYDGQATWESNMAPSSIHGVTTVVVGNCGVGFAPCRPEQREALVELMEGIEDIPEIVMTEGLPWNWETFPEYLDALAKRNFDVDIATQLPHSALRIYVMGERGARREPATQADLAAMRRLTAEAIASGALGVSTSRSLMHRTVAGELAPTNGAARDELVAIALGLRDAGRGVFQLIPDVDAPAGREFAVIREVAAASGGPVSFSLAQQAPYTDPRWRDYLNLLEEANAAGLPIRAQVFPRPIGMLYGLELSTHQFSLNPSYKAIAKLPLARRVEAMRNPELRRRILSEQPEHSNPVYHMLVNFFRNAYRMSDPPSYAPNLADRLELLAQQSGRDFLDYAYDALLEEDGKAVFFLPGTNFEGGRLDAAREMVRHPNTVIGLGDGGAHYGAICDASYTTFVLQDVRDAQDEGGLTLEDAVRRLTTLPASCVGLSDRGALRPGMRADINVIDLDRLQLRRPSVVRNLPGGGRRLHQAAEGYDATIVAGQVTYRDGIATGALPGRLVRGG